VNIEYEAASKGAAFVFKLKF